MALQFIRHRVRPLWVTFQEPVATGDGFTTTFPLPAGASEHQKLVVYLNGNPLPSDAKVPCMEGVGEPLLTKDGKPVIDKDGNAVLSKGRPVLQEKDGLKIPVYTPVGWKLVAGALEFAVPPPVGCDITISRILASVDDVEAEAFQFGKVDPNLMLEMQTDRPDPDDDMLKTAEELEEERKRKDAEFRKLTLDARKKKKAAEKKLEKERSDLYFGWISRVFFKIVIGWNIKAVDEAGETIDVPFTEQNVTDYLNGDGSEGDRVRALNLAFWLMARSGDIVRAQAERTAGLTKN